MHLKGSLKIEQNGISNFYWQSFMPKIICLIQSIYKIHGHKGGNESRGYF
jgi:hypothetical protein